MSKAIIESQIEALTAVAGGNVAARCARIEELKAKLAALTA